MFKQFISQLSGSENYMIASLLVFFVFFVLVGFYLWFMKKDFTDVMRNMPLNEQNNNHE